MKQKFKHIFLPISLILILIIITALAGCSLGNPTRESELKDLLKITQKDLSSAFSKKEGKYSLVAEHVFSWAKKNKINVIENNDNNMVLENPATKGNENNETIVLHSKVNTNDIAASMYPLSVGLTGLIGPESHGTLRLIITEDDNGNLIGAETIDPKNYTSDNFISLTGNNESSLITNGPYQLTGQMSKNIQTAAPKHTDAYTITMSMPDFTDPFDYETNYPNPIEIIGGLLATQKSSGVLYDLASFSCKTTSGYTPNSATAVVVIDENDVESFTTKFEKSQEKIKKKFDKIDENFVYTMTETSLPDKVISPDDSNSIISVIYTIQKGIYQQDEDTGEISAASNLSFINTTDNNFEMHVNARSLNKNLLDEMDTAFLTTSSLSNISYNSIDKKVTWSASLDKTLSSFFIDALDIKKDKLKTFLNTTELDILSSKAPNLNIISYSFPRDNSESALLNILHFSESLVK